MPSRTIRADDQIQSLAAEFGRSWVTGNGVKPWLRRQAPRLSKLVRVEGWSWDDIGRAMTVAGISYATGRPWTGDFLARKASEARLQLRAHGEQQRQVGGRRRGGTTPDVGNTEAPAAAAEAAILSVQLPAPAPATTDMEPPRRTFGLASPRGWTPAPAPSDIEPKPAPSVAAPVIDVDAVIARFLGRPDPPTSSKDGT